MKDVVYRRTFYGITDNFSLLRQYCLQTKRCVLGYSEYMNISTQFNPFDLEAYALLILFLVPVLVMYWLCFVSGSVLAVRYAI